jgi:hypothetical protein
MPLSVTRSSSKTNIGTFRSLKAKQEGLIGLVILDQPAHKPSAFIFD